MHVRPVQRPRPCGGFVVHGRNTAARDGMFAFLRSLGLKPLEFSALIASTGRGAPYIAEVLDKAFQTAQAVIVLFTPDEIAYLRGEYATPGEADAQPQAQARPNVLFEAGMALGRNPNRTILVELGAHRPFSDVSGMHALRMDDGPDRRTELAQRLRTAGCPISQDGTDWLRAGDLAPPPPPGNGLSLGRRLPETARSGPRLDARYQDTGRSSGKIEITNRTGQDFYDVDLTLPPEAGSVSLVSADLPIKKLPAWRSVKIHAMRFMGEGDSRFEATLTARTADGEQVVETPFIDLQG